MTVCCPCSHDFASLHKEADAYPRLLADIGGTHARFCVETSSGNHQARVTFPVRKYASFEAALDAYFYHEIFQSLAMARVPYAALAVAGNVEGDDVALTNSGWQFSCAALRKRFQFDLVFVANDFIALAAALPYLSEEEKIHIGGGTPKSVSPIAVLGAGTGLGMAALCPQNNTWQAIASEGGHISFAPTDERELAVLRFAWGEYGRVSVERLLSGDGLVLIYRALAYEAGLDVPLLSAQGITAKAQSERCALCLETVAVFCGVLGSVAGDVALMFSAKGGVYLGGGVVFALETLFDRELFRQRFENKGRFLTHMQSIPTHLIQADTPAFLGVSILFTEEILKSSQAD